MGATGRGEHGRSDIPRRYRDGLGRGVDAAGQRGVLAFVRSVGRVVLPVFGGNRVRPPRSRSRILDPFRGVRVRRAPGGRVGRLSGIVGVTDGQSNPVVSSPERSSSDGVLLVRVGTPRAVAERSGKSHQSRGVAGDPRPEDRVRSAGTGFREGEIPIGGARPEPAPCPGAEPSKAPPAAPTGPPTVSAPPHEVRRRSSPHSVRRPTGCRSG